MSFAYETLKQITGTEIVDGTVTSSNIVDGTVVNSNIASNSVSSSTVASGSVNLQGTAITGSLPIGYGGLQISGVGSATRAYRGDISFRNYGIYGINVFTSSGTWTRPTDVRFIKVSCQGGGGGGSGHGESGGAGGYSELVLDVRSIGSVSVSIGGDSGSSFYSGAGSQGSSVSFGPYCSASGGYGANQNNQHSGGLGGVGSGGNLNIYGGGGANHHQESGIGGASFWGGSVAGGHPQGGNFSHNHQSHSAPGSGGAGAYFHGHYGSAGKAGMIVVYMYY
jgi:hypothetical protein